MNYPATTDTTSTINPDNPLAPASALGSIGKLGMGGEGVMLNTYTPPASSMKPKPGSKYL